MASEDGVGKIYGTPVENDRRLLAEPYVRKSSLSSLILKLIFWKKVCGLLRKSSTFFFG